MPQARTHAPSVKNSARRSLFAGVVPQVGVAVPLWLWLELELGLELELSRLSGESRERPCRLMWLVVMARVRSARCRASFMSWRILSAGVLRYGGRLLLHP